MSIRLLKGQEVAGSVIYCHYCDATAADEDVAAGEGWLAGVWDSWKLLRRPICPGCVKARCSLVDGEYHLDEKKCRKKEGPQQVGLFGGDEEDGPVTVTLEPKAAREYVETGCDLDAVGRLIDLTITRLESLKCDPLTVSDLRTSRQKLRSVQRQLKLTVHQAERLLRAAPQEQQQTQQA